jgi:hypothetical protein
MGSGNQVCEKYHRKNKDSDADVEDRVRGGGPAGQSIV